MNTNAHALPQGSARFPASQRDFCLAPGLVLRAGPTVFRVTSIDGEVATLEHSISFERKVILVSHLLAELTAGRSVVAGPADAARALEGDVFSEDEHRVIESLPLDEFSDAQREHVVRVMRYVSGLRRLGYTKVTLASPTLKLDLDRLRKQFGDPRPVTPTWVYKWSLKLNKAAGDPRAVIPLFSKRGGRGGKRVAPLVEEAIARAVKRRRDDPTAKIRAQGVLMDAKSILHIEYPERPDLVLSLNWTTVSRRVKDEFSAYDICRRNEGKAVANRQFRTSYPRDRAEFPLEAAETDDTDAFIFLVDEKSALPCGRGYLTGVLDQETRNLQGWELSHAPRSTWSAASALIHAILPKDPTHPDFATCATGCEFYGKPGIVVFDNALQNHAKEMEEIARSISIDPAWAKPRTPTEKSDQEGWFGRLKREFLPSLPGFRGDKKLRDGLMEGQSAANMGLLEFRQAFVQWTYDNYANTPQADGLTPRQRWHIGTRLAKPRVPVDIYGLRLIPCLHKTLRLREGGIRFVGLIYRSAFLEMLGKTLGHNAEVRFRFNPKDLSEIYAFDPKARVYIPVPAADQAYARGLTLYQHKLVRKLARDAKLRNPSIPQLLLQRERLQTLTRQLRYSKKLRDRKIAARTGEIPSADGDEEPSLSPPTQTVCVTELEDRILEIEHVEMDTEDDGWRLPNV